MAAVPADLEIRPLRPGDDPDAQLDLSERAFGPVAAAIAARGFPAAISLSVPLRIADDARPANSGRWQLSVAGGEGRFALAGPDAPAGPAVTLGARGLAALYAGTPLVTLRQAGLAAGGTADDDAALDAAFAATPYMLDAF